MIRAQRPLSRLAFTLVELLVVLAIIAILVALTTAGVLAIMKKGPATVATHEIGQLDTAIQNFKTAYKVDYIPSRLFLAEGLGEYTGRPNDPLAQESLAYLVRVWPQLTAPGGPWSQPPSSRLPGVPQFIDWNGNGKLDSGVVLEGDQCLVFFLGGIPIQGTPAGCAGFSTDPRDPSKVVNIPTGLPAPNNIYPAQTANRKGPFFEFPSDRLYQRDMLFLTNPTVSNYPIPFYSYADAHSNKSQKTPYAYFSSYGVRNGYNKYGSSDCPTLFYRPPVAPSTAGIPIQPYFEAPGRYLNPTGHQIISAGADALWGPGGQWSTLTTDSIAIEGRDDQSNFYGRLLGN